ncbi:MAG: phosphomannomutase/phosphoglucomutase [bacterium]|nr:phosphomannomutase/phosphoglucomutase [bacterium]
MSINPDIFKAYDIRGVVPKQLDTEGAKKIGNAIVVFLARKYKKQALTIVVGADVRASSPMIKKALIEGITLHGSSVIDIGTVTTPLFYFLLQEHASDGGVMVTASHNPPEYNGFKIRGRNTVAIAENSGLKTIQKLTGKKELIRGKKLGSISEKKNGADKYIAYLLKKVKLGKARVVVDASGGAATLILPKLLSHFPGVLYKPLFFKPDGSFSHHDPNPVKPESQEFIKEELASGSFDFGVVFDGDGDRIVFFDEFGREVRGDFIVALLAGELLKEHPKSFVVMNATASKAVEEYITSLGGKFVRTKQGYVYISSVMREKRAILGGETSHHFYFRDFGCNESSMYALLKMLEIMARTPKKLSHLVGPLQKYVTAPETNFEVGDKARVIRAVLKYFKKDGKVSRLDGITINFPDWWFIIRPSNTEPLIRLTVEAKTQELFDEKLKELSEFIKRAS